MTATEQQRAPAMAESDTRRNAYASVYRATYRRTLDALYGAGWPLQEAVKMAECNARHDAMQATQAMAGAAVSMTRLPSVANNTKGA